MIIQDTNYLNEKLTKLKQSVLSKNNQIMNSGTKTNSYQKNTYNYVKNENLPNYKESQQKRLLFSTNQQPNLFKYNKEIKTNVPPNYTNIAKPKLMSLRNININEKSNRMQSLKEIQKPEYIYPEIKNNYLRDENLDTKNLKINLRNSKSVDPFKIYSQQLNEKVIRNYENFQPNIQNNNILDSVLKVSQFGKRQLDLQNDLNERLNDEIRENEQLIIQMNNLQNKLDEEKRRLENIDNHFREDLKNIKIREEEKLLEAEKMHSQAEEFTQRLIYEENLKNELSCDFDKIQYDNKMLKTELKRIGELTAEKLLDLENNINSIGRMKEFEKENYDMEKEKINNSSEFVIEQMKSHFEERSSQIINNIKQNESDRKKTENDLKSLSNELKNFNNNADIQIRNLMSNIIHEQETKQNKEIKEIEDTIKIEENQLNSFQMENRNLIENFQNLEREFKNNLMNKKNTNIRLKEELASLENSYNKIFVGLNSENKNVSQKQHQIQKLEEELKDVETKMLTLQENYKNELEEIEVEQNEIVIELNHEFENLLSSEKDLIREIELKNEKLINLEMNHNQAIEMIQKKLNNTLQSD